MVVIHYTITKVNLADFQQSHKLRKGNKCKTTDKHFQEHLSGQSSVHIVEGFPTFDVLDEWMLFRF